MSLISKIKFLAVVVASTVIFSCTVEDGQDGVDGLQGAQGEQGPAGQDGADGEDGTNGADGTDGEDGNANVFASEWIPQMFGSSEATFRSFEVTEARVTSEIINSGAVLVFGKRPGNILRVEPWPVTYIGVINQKYSFILDIEGRIQFTAETNDNSSRAIFNRYDEVRYVIIPSNNTTGKNTTDNIKLRMKKEGVDFNNYFAVCDYLGLEY